MKNLMVYVSGSGRPSKLFNTYLAAQVENSLRLGWSMDDIILCSNFPCEHRGLKARFLGRNGGLGLLCHKTYAAYSLFKEGLRDDVWLHDLDAWQTFEMRPPRFEDVGICRYKSEGKVNSGSVFYRPGSMDVLEHVLREFSRRRARKEEPTMTEVLSGYGSRVTYLNNRYNVGSKHMATRVRLSEKPILVAHFHPNKARCWRKFCENKTNEVVPGPLRNILEDKFYPGGFPG